MLAGNTCRRGGDTIADAADLAYAALNDETYTLVGHGAQLSSATI